MVAPTPAPSPRTQPVGGNGRGGCGRSGGTDPRHRLPRRPTGGAVILPAAACAAPWRGRRSAADAPRRRQPIPASHSFETTRPLVMAILPDRESFGHSCVVHASQKSFQAEHVPQFPTLLLDRQTQQPLLPKHCGHAHRQGREAVGREVVGGWPGGAGRVAVGRDAVVGWPGWDWCEAVGGEVAAVWPGTADEALSGCPAPDMVLVYQSSRRCPDGGRRRR